MIRSAYIALLRGPQFRGRHRIESILRRLLVEPVDRIDEGLRMKLDPQEWLQIGLLAKKPQEPKTAKLIRNMLRPGDTFVDVGAHVGWLSLIAARCVGAGGRVVAIDPQPYNCERILSNAELNGFDNIVVVSAAISDRDDFVILAQQTSTDKARLTVSGLGVNDTDSRFVCACLTLDALLGRLAIDSIRMIKIDVEGHEGAVLLGAADALRRTQNVVLEILPGSAGGSASAQQQLEAIGFEFCQVDGSSWQPGQPSLENNVWARKRPA